MKPLSRHSFKTRLNCVQQIPNFRLGHFRHWHSVGTSSSSSPSSAVSKETESSLSSLSSLSDTWQNTGFQIVYDFSDNYTFPLSTFWQIWLKIGSSLKWGYCCDQNFSIISSPHHRTCRDLTKCNSYLALLSLHCHCHSHNQNYPSETNF